jgi:hydrogenase maturation protease
LRERRRSITDCRSFPSIPSSLRQGADVNWPIPVRVVGVGSPQGDDAVAWAVVAQLQVRLARGQGLRDGIELHRVAGGQRLLELLDGRGSLLLIDALEPGAAPGSIHRWDWPDGPLAGLRPGSTHELGPAAALELAAALGLLPPRVAVWAVTAEQLAALAPLSPAVAAAVPQLVQSLADELGLPPEVG